MSIESLKEGLEQVLTSLNGSNLKSAPFNWNYCLNKSKQFKNCFIYCPKLNKRILKLLRSQKMWFVSPMVWTTLHHILFGLMRLLVGLILNLWMGQLEQKIGELPFSLIGISRNLTNQLLFEHPNPFSPDMALQGSFYFVVCNLIQSIW